MVSLPILTLEASPHNPPEQRNPELAYEITQPDLPAKVQEIDREEGRQPLWAE
jgi:hypothetical protein